jgi:hypothetical protein
MIFVEKSVGCLMADFLIYDVFHFEMLAFLLGIMVL